MGRYEDKLKLIAASGGFSAPNATRLSTELNQFADRLWKIYISPGWEGKSADSARERINSLRQEFRKLADTTDEVQRNYRYADSAVEEANSALDALPGTDIPQFLVDAAKVGADVLYGGLSLPAKAAIDSAADALSSGREKAAKAAVRTFKEALNAKNVELKEILDRGPIDSGPGPGPGPGPEPEPEPEPEDEDEGGSDSTDSGGEEGGYDGSDVPPDWSSVQPGSADTAVPAVSSPGSSGSGLTGAGDGVHRLRPDGAVSPSDPRGVEGHASGGFNGDRSGSGSGVGSGRVDLGGKSSSTVFGGGGGIGAGILGAGGIGAGARLASGGLKGLGGAGGGAVGAGGGQRLGAGGAGTGGGAGARLGGAGGGIGSASGGGVRSGGGLSGAAASSTITTGPGGPSAGLGSGGATGTGTGGGGFMGGGGAPGSPTQDRGRSRGLGGLIAPKIEDDDDKPIPRSAGAGPGSRDGT